MYKSFFMILLTDFIYLLNIKGHYKTQFDLGSIRWPMDLKNQKLSLHGFNDQSSLENIHIVNSRTQYLKLWENVYFISLYNPQKNDP